MPYCYCCCGCRMSVWEPDARGVRAEDGGHGDQHVRPQAVPTGTVQHSLPGHGDQHVRPQAVPAGTSLPVLQVLTTWKTGILITFPVGWSEKCTWSTAFVHIRKSRQNAKSLHPIPQQLCHFTVLLSYQCTTAITTTLCSSTFLPVHGNHDTLHLYLL